MEQDRTLKNSAMKSLNICCCPRFYKGLIIADGRAPLNKYTTEITANNCKRIINEENPEKNEISSFNPGDGMIYHMSKLHKNNDEEGIKLLICICMYNESRTALQTTLNGIYSNLKSLRENNITEHNIAVVVIQDGILKLVQNQKTRTYQKGLKSIIQFYREIDQSQGKEKCQLEQRINVILDEIDNFQRKQMKDVIQHNSNFPPSIDKSLSLLYQNLWSPNLNQPSEAKLKLYSCFKHKNGTKLSSHLWFFQGFCRQFNPQMCILLDVGTKPSQKSILKLMEALQDEHVGGVTGFMSIDANFISEEGESQEEKSNCFVNALASIEKAQEFQYIMSHLLDKNFESALGFLHVLPGAWSGYKYKALIQGQKFEQNLLEKKYFKMILDPSHEERDHQQANMYLAEDRILSLGIYCQPNKSYRLKYVPDAVAYTDPMKSHEQLMNQRRRWINSSYFAFMYVFRNYSYNVEESDHSFWRKTILLPFNMLIAFLSFANGYLTPGIYCFILYTTIVQSVSNRYVEYCAQIVVFIYILLVIVSVAWSLFGTQWTKSAHIVSYVFSFYTFLLLGLVIWNVVIIYLGVATITSLSQILQNTEGTIVILLSLINIGSFLLLALLHLPTHPYFVVRLLIDSISYLVFQGAYSHVMLIYSFCNIDNVSWGTKGNNGSRQKRYLQQKVLFVSRWLLCNAILCFLCIYIDFILPRNSQKGVMLLVIAVYASLLIFLKTIIASFHQIKWVFFEKCCSRVKIDREKNHKLTEYWQKYTTNQ